MSLADRIIYQRPEEAQISVVKVAVEGTHCPECNGTDVRRYPIAWCRGPRIVVKCQDCYHPLSIERPQPEDRWPPFRALAYNWDVSVAERPNAK